MGLLKFMMEVELELELFGPERHDAIFDWVKYIISKYILLVIILKKPKQIHKILYLYNKQ